MANGSCPSNRKTATQYSGGSLATITDPAGRTLTFSYSGSLVSSVSDSATPSRTLSYSCDGSSNLTQVTDVRGANTVFTYDASHELLTMKDPNCLATACGGVRNTYSGGKVTKQVDGRGRVELAGVPGLLWLDELDRGLCPIHEVRHGEEGAHPAIW